MSLRIASGSSSPSFLEVVAAHRLEKSVRDAFSYVLSVLADRASTGGLRLLRYDSELFLLFSLIAQGTSLATNGASLAESLYGLRRAGVLASGKQGQMQTTTYLSMKQLLLSCFFLVGAPYIASWAFGDPQQAATGILPPLSALEEPPPLVEDSSDHEDEETELDRATTSGTAAADNSTAFQNTPNQSFHTARDGSQVPIATTSWNNDAEADPDPTRGLPSTSTLTSAESLPPNGTTTDAPSSSSVHNNTGNSNDPDAPGAAQQVFAAAAPSVARIRSQRRQKRGALGRQAERVKAQAATRARLWQHGMHTRSPAALAAAASLWTIHTVGNNTKSAIMAALVLFKVLEWWFTAGEEKVEEARRNVPPPPPAYPPHPGGMALISDASVCPLCHRKRVAPAQLATSGYVFCYKCVFTAVAAHHRCPVTHIRSSLDDIRRLFLSAR